MLRKLLQRWFVRHVWVYDPAGERRCCLQCGRREELLDSGGALGGPVWGMLAPGDIGAHFSRRDERPH